MCEICNKGMKVFSTVNNIGFCIRKDSLIIYTKEENK